MPSSVPGWLGRRGGAHAGIDDKRVRLNDQQDGYKHNHCPPGSQAAAASHLGVGADEQRQQHRQLEASGDCGTGGCRLPAGSAYVRVWDMAGRGSSDQN